MQRELTVLGKPMCFLLIISTFLFSSCAADMLVQPDSTKNAGNYDSDGAFRSLEKCMNEEEPEIQMGVYGEGFITLEENNQLTLQSDSDGGLSAVVALTLVGICPEDLAEITLSAELDDNTVATASFEYFDGFCTPEITWLLPQLGLSFVPGISLFDLVDQTIILKTTARLADDTIVSTEANVEITP